MTGNYREITGKLGRKEDCWIYTSYGKSPSHRKIMGNRGVPPRGTEIGGILRDSNFFWGFNLFSSFQINFGGTLLFYDLRFQG